MEGGGREDDARARSEPAHRFRTPGDLTAEMNAIGRRARAAARRIALAPAQTKDTALRLISERLRAERDTILAENARDVEAARAAGQTQALIDRLTLDAGRLDAIADAVAKIGALPDPVGRQIAAFERPNGLLIERIAVPSGSSASSSRAAPTSRRMPAPSA